MKKNTIARSIVPGCLSAELLATVDGGILNFDLGEKNIKEEIKGTETNSDNTYSESVGNNYGIKYAGSNPDTIATLYSERNKLIADNKPKQTPPYPTPVAS
jgi:hypothetical protein